MNPPPVIPVPAFGFSELRGRRIVVGLPGVGFRGELRADNPVRQNARTLVPVITEVDYYRAEAQGIEVFAVLVPIERVWVESTSHAPQARLDVTALDAPAPRWPVPLAGQAHVIGRRVIHLVPDGFARDLRAVTDRYPGPAGVERIRVCPEHEWYGWGFGGSVPQSEELPVNQVWLE